jgi:hypothetical protein
MHVSVRHAVRKRFFLKKEARTFAIGVSGAATLTPYGQEFFGSFLQKRSACLSATAGPPAAKRGHGLFVL